VSIEQSADRGSIARAAQFTRGGRGDGAAAAFAVAFTATLTVALLLSAKRFYGDSNEYWELARTFTQHGHFSLLNFSNEYRGYVLPLLFHGLQAFGGILSATTQVKLFNALLFALIGTVLAPWAAKTAWPQRRWGFTRRLALTALLLVFWDGALNFPMSDFPGLAAALLALAAAGRPYVPGWMLVAGFANALALSIRPPYLPFTVALGGVVAWAWLTRREGQRASPARRALCAVMFALGLAVVSLPQVLSAQQHHLKRGAIPRYSVNALSHKQGALTVGMELELASDSTFPEGMFYHDEGGALRLLRSQKNRFVTTRQYLEFIVWHPLVMAGVYVRHIINGLDERYNTPFVEHIGSNWWRRIASFLIVFLALLRLLWPAARRSLGPARWRYIVVLALTCLTSVPIAIATRYMLPVWLICCMLVLTSGWPSPLEPAGAGVGGLRRYRKLAIILGAYLVSMALVYEVVTATTRGLHNHG